jgi:dTDP-4-dehydrorhamnose reductase
MRAIVTGSSGYIGKQLFTEAQNHFDSYGTKSSITVREGSLLPLRLDVPNQFDFGLIHQSDVVFLTAAISAPDVCAHERDRAWATNVTGTCSFIESVIERGAHVIFFSSDTVYGERNECVEEDADCHPAGEYAEMKHEVEKRFIGNLLFKVIRLSYVFSGEDKLTKYLLGCGERGEEAELFHPFFRSIVHRNDVVDGVLALAKRWDEFPHQIINFGGPEILSRIDFAECVKKYAFPGLKFRITEPSEAFFKNRPRTIAMKSNLLPALLGRPVHSLAEAVQIEFGEDQ